MHLQMLNAVTNRNTCVNSNVKLTDSDLYKMSPVTSTVPQLNLCLYIKGLL